MQHVLRINNDRIAEQAVTYKPVSKRDMDIQKGRLHRIEVD